MPTKAWTDEQYEWLRARLHLFNDDDRKGFFEEVKNDFVKAFPADGDRANLKEVCIGSRPHRSCSPCVQKIRQWFYHQGRKVKVSKPTARSILGFKSRKPAPLTRGQAYSLLFCKRGSPLHDELQNEYKLYRTADEATLNKYQHLFPAGFNPAIKFLVFQQIILKERVLSAPAEEVSAVEAFINERYEEQTRRAEYPWTASRTDESQTDAELERDYVERYVSSLLIKPP